uniref:Phosphoserine phosphatase n=1 Tax=Anopheles maculatus TaxID=74869 RepID=A0A182SAR0_9DIPT
MRGELDFTASLRQRVGTLKGADANILQQVRDELPLMPGLTSLVHKLQALDWHVAIASGGFTYYAEYLRDKLKLVAIAANELEIRDGKLTGEVLGPVVDAQHKADTLVKLAEKLGIPLQQTVAIGDGANDLKMMQVAGLGIAYHAKPKVYEKAQVSIRHADLLGVLCVLTGSLKHEGQCSACHAWNTITEVRLAAVSSSSARTERFSGYAGDAGVSRVQKLSDISLEALPRFSTGFLEFDRVLGGGVVPGSAILIGGNPGAGKSTLLLQVLCKLAEQMKTLYVTGEE